MKELCGKRVLITGGAHGIGLEMAIQFAESGSEIILADLNEKALPDAAEAVAVLGVPVHSYAVDVTDPQSVATLRAQIHQDSGSVDVLINNAGVVYGGSFLDVPLARHVATMRVNALGPVVMTHAFLSDLIGRPEGHLVNIASASGFIGLPFGSTYASSKWAAIGFSESIRLELEQLGHKHVHVTAVCPSYINTGMFEGVSPPRSTRMLTPDFIARRVVDAVRHNRPYVIEPWLARVTPSLKGVLPTRMFDAIATALGATSSMAGWRGHGKTD